ncbi:hypothetical protein MKW92_022699 [Papaver armeniacum]|nr:hypothetical protein MKW92_022699 [Papaver armeniacum]
MERFSLREHVLLGSSSSPRRSSLSSTKLQSRNSDVDFNDVFGGPPRRSSMHEWRNSNNSLSDTINSNSSGGDDEDDGNIPSRNPWSGLSSEKPVFGEETITRRNSPSKDFYDDIFKGDGLTTSTPTRLSWDHLHSNPASRVLSPARSMHTPPPQSDSFGGSSLPVLLSLPPKLAKGVDQAFSSPSHSPFKSKESSSAAFGSSSSPSVSRASTPVAQGQEELRNDVQHSYTRAGKAEGIESELPKPVVQEISISSKNQSCGLNTITKDTKVVEEVARRKPVSEAETKNVKNKVKGRVKDFVKIFNQEVPVTHVPSVETVIQSQRTGAQDMGECKADDQENVVQKKAGNNEKVPSQRSNEVSVDTSSKDQVVEQLDKPRVAEDRTSYKTYVASSERNDTSTSCPEPIPVVVEAVITNMEESHYEDLQGNCLVEVLPPEPDKQSEADQLNEEIKASDVKIRKWSSGKQGNIRSLLSTLQYVLWPGSGWKPVPLMDIIEQNSVRKAYQKALLCLHPDKLQQRGALPHQKYTAEKVFDILQEAWTQNNSVGAL